MKEEGKLLHILPLKMPPITTYQGSSFVLGIILANERVQYCFDNKYINVRCHDSEDIFELKLHFTEDMWEDYRRVGLAEMDLFYVANISKSKFTKFLRERIEQGNYILLHYIDEFYLSYSNNYMKKHILHDSYIYGYENDMFYVMAYTKGRLNMIKVPQKQVVKGVYACLRDERDAHFCTFRICHNVQVVENVNQMFEELHMYIDGTVEKNRGDIDCSYGVNTYDVIKKCIEKYIYQETPEKLLDIRVFHVLWEHKKVLSGHIQRMCEILEMDNAHKSRLSGIIDCANRIFMLSMKYNITFDVEILELILSNMEKMKSMEKEILDRIVNEMEECKRRVQPEDC